MLIYPIVNHIAFHLGPVEVHWYGLMYLLSFLMGWFYLISQRHRMAPPLTQEQTSDLIFYCALGVIVGGRLGYMLFYDLSAFVHAPWMIVQVWHGGMSFHGGFLGVILALYGWSKRNAYHVLDVADLLAPIVPLGIAAGRMGNFLEGELWGKVTTLPWGMVYLNPLAGHLTRHPSELYEFLLEGILLFVVLWFFSRKKHPRGMVSSVFLIGYGLARMLCEFFRAPDPQWGYLAFGWLTMGQILSIPMFLIGVIWLIKIIVGARYAVPSLQRAAKKL